MAWAFPPRQPRSGSFSPSKLQALAASCPRGGAGNDQCSATPVMAREHRLPTALHFLPSVDVFPREAQITVNQRQNGSSLSVHVSAMASGPINPRRALSSQAIFRICIPPCRGGSTTGKPPMLTQTVTMNDRSEEHTSTLLSRMHISYAVFCL